MEKTSIRSASGSFDQDDIERCASVRQLRLWRFTVEQDILCITMQLEKYANAEKVVEGWTARAKCCLKLQEILLSKIDEQIFLLEGMFIYKDFAASVRYSKEDNAYVGRIEGIDSIVSFDGESLIQLEEAFKEAVEDYINFCNRKKG